MIGALGTGVLAGVGAVLVVRALFPPRPSLASVLAQVRVVATPAPLASVEGPSGVIGRVGAALAHALAAVGVETGSLSGDLAVMGRSLEEHMATKAVTSVVSALAVLVSAVVVALGGAALPMGVVLSLVVAAGVVGFVAPDALLRQAAAGRRREFRQALAFFLDLMIVVLSGSAGPATAVRAAAYAGEGWVYERLRRTLEEGRLRRQEPWVVLGQLGAEFGVDELEELSAAVALAERQGASVRRSLAAKAAVIVDQQLAEAEARAKSATVRMSGPLVLLGIGFAALFLYGAVMSVFSVIP